MGNYSVSQQNASGPPVQNKPVDQRSQNKPVDQWSDSEINQVGKKSSSPIHSWLQIKLKLTSVKTNLLELQDITKKFQT